MKEYSPVPNKNFKNLNEDAWWKDGSLFLQPVSSSSVLTYNNLKKNALAGILFFLLNLYYLISDLVRGFYYTPYAFPNLIAVLLMLIPSAYIFCLSLIKRDRYDTLLNRLSLLGYYLCIVASVTIFTYTANIRGFKAGADIEFVGITLSTIYLMLFMIAPLHRLDDSLLVIISMVAGTVLPAFLPGKELYSLFKQLSLRIIIIVGYFYFRRQDRLLAHKNSEVQNLNRQLRIASLTDSLTGTYNRNAFEQFFRNLRIESKSPKLGMILFDIDNFKSYNDCYSHNEGDKALKSVCEGVMATLTPDDPFLFRFGGEEFIVLVDHADDEKLIALAEKYREAVYNRQISRSDIDTFDRITVSVGCALFQRDDNQPVETYISEADAQMYLCKDHGKNCSAINGTIFNSKMKNGCSPK